MNSSVILIFTILFILLSILLLLLLFREIRYCTCRSSYSCINFNPYVETGSGEMSPRFLKSVEIILWEKKFFIPFFSFLRGGGLGVKMRKWIFLPNLETYREKNYDESFLCLTMSTWWINNAIKGKKFRRQRKEGD